MMALFEHEGKITGEDIIIQAITKIQNVFKRTNNLSIKAVQ